MNRHPQQSDLMLKPSKPADSYFVQDKFHSIRKLASSSVKAMWKCKLAK